MAIANDLKGLCVCDHQYLIYIDSGISYLTIILIEVGPGELYSWELKLSAHMLSLHDGPCQSLGMSR